MPEKERKKKDTGNTKKREGPFRITNTPQNVYRLCYRHRLH